MKKLTNYLILMFVVLTSVGARAAVGSNVTRVVGGDLSLVPAYEAAGDKWLDADGKTINTQYSDGMITYLRDVAGWTSVRVRLLVDPSQDDYVSTCQDLDYVKQLGKRVKDAGMYFLLDIFYSDTWTDVSKQWIPKSWNYTRNTATATLAAKVKSYTTEVLNTLTAYGAQPDYVQVGNEVSYGMLWDSASGAKLTNAFYTSGTYNNYSTQITRFATLLKAAAEGVRAATNGSEMKIVLHSERTYYSTQTANFYTWVEQAGFTDYDVIGLSYYPVWHGAMDKLTATLSSLQSRFPSKEIQIVETGYHNTTPSNQTYDTSSTWPYTAAGQASFLSDLTTTLNGYANVTGLYYWQAEECGNGANSSGVSQVMDSWDNRGFWECSWKSGSHKLNSSAALMALKNFNHTVLGESGGGGSEGEYTVTDISDQFTNLDFEDCTWNDGGWYADCPGWTINWDMGWSDNPWPKAADQWHSSLCDGVLLSAWNAGGNALTAGNVLSQSLGELPAGKYTVTAAVHCDYDGLYLFANDSQTKVTPTTDWGTAHITIVEAELSDAGSLTIGLKFPSNVSTTDQINLYLDNFTVTQTLSSGSGSGEGNEETDYTSHIGDYGFEESVHFEWDNGAWTTGDEVWLWDYAEEGTSPYTVTTNQWAANQTNLCMLWTENPVTASGHIFCQTVKDLPNGTYTLTVELCDEKGNLYLFGGDQATAAGEGSTVWSSVNTLTLTEVEVTDGTLQIGLGVDGTLGTNVSGYVDNFHLTLTALAENQDKTLTYTHEGITYTYNTGTKVAYVSGFTAADLPTEAEGQVLLGEFTVDGETYYPSYIGEWALQGYPLYWLDVPSGITVVGKGALYGSSLSNVTFYTNDYLSIYDYAFTGWEDGLADGNQGTKGSPLYNVTLYAESTDHVTVSDKAFCPDDIDEATLWVVKGLQDETAYTGLGFQHVYPMGVTVGDVNDDDQVTIADVTALVNIILGKGGSYIQYAADVNGDGQITIADVTALVNKILGKSSL